MSAKYGKLALCLNGAGSKGIVQAGEIQAFLDLGFEYDEIYGSSAGSLNGALLHQGDVDQIKNLWMNITNKDVYTWSPLNVLDALGDKACLYDSSPLKRTIDKYCSVEKLMLNPKPFYIASTDYSSWYPFIPNMHHMQPEDIPVLLYASASCPIYFPYVEWNGARLSDAGIMSNYNIRAAIDNGADTIVVMGFAVPEPSEPQNIKDSIAETLSVSVFAQFIDELDMVENINKLVPKLPPDSGYRIIKLVRIIPPKSLGIPLMDFDLKGRDRNQLWQYGYDLAKTILQKELLA